MAENDLHHLVVLDDDGRACGMVSSLDLVRALVGLPPAHPATFPHRDPVFDVTWTDPRALDRESAASAPVDPGVLVLSAGGASRVETDVWAESTAALRARIAELVELPHADTPALARVLGLHGLRFRCAAVADPSRRDVIATTLQRRIGS
jgi:CBS domain-containing protein